MTPAEMPLRSSRAATCFFHSAYAPGGAAGGLAFGLRGTPHLSMCRAREKTEHKLSDTPPTCEVHFIVGISRPHYLLSKGENVSNTRIITHTLAVAGVLFIGGQAMAQGGPSVTVVNTPLPVTVTNPTVAPSTVNVGNTAVLAAAIAQALAQALAVIGTPVAKVLDTQSPYTVPVGQRLVIEYVDGECRSSFPGLDISTNGIRIEHTFPVLPDPAVADIFLFAGPAKFYVDPGTVVRVNPNCVLRLSGRLVSG